MLSMSEKAISPEKQKRIDELRKEIFAELEAIPEAVNSPDVLSEAKGKSIHTKLFEKYAEGYKKIIGSS